MPILSIIAAVDEHFAIGKNNQLLCYLKSDLQHFKQLTLHHPVIMGKHTFLSLPNGALPHRKNIVLTSQPFVSENVFVAHSLSEALEWCEKEEEIFIIGGSSLYRQTIDLADKMYLTRIHTIFEADAFFPLFDQSQWRITFSEKHFPDEWNPYAFTFENYERIKQ
ncbi:MAG: dihydrofolate reductase [Microbacter sp.]